MNFISFFIHILVIVCLVGICKGASSKNDQALLVVSYDSFRPDYLNRNVTPNLNKFRSEGTSARFMRPVFPTKTLVNHFTIATGLYADKHGVLANQVYDSKYGKLLTGKESAYELFHYNESVIPIWTANEMARKTSGCMWPGGNFEYHRINCTFKIACNWKHPMPFEMRVNKAIEWFTHKKTPANLVMLYFEQPDKFGHLYGPNSARTIEQVKRVDEITGYIQNKLIQNNLEDRVNVIHLSDHGMQFVPKRNFINLTELTITDSFDTYGNSPVLQIVPKNANLEDEILLNLTKVATKNGHFKVYNQKTLPRRWHANNPRRFGPILAVADDEYAFVDAVVNKYQQHHKNVPSDQVFGVHGYDNAYPSMQATFMAKGPLFSKGKVLESINMVDLYNLFCKILEIKCGPTDGTDIHSDILKEN